jgi:hypothetical protein
VAQTKLYDTGSVGHRNRIEGESTRDTGSQVRIATSRMGAARHILPGCARKVAWGDDATAKVFWNIVLNTIEHRSGAQLQGHLQPALWMAFVQVEDGSWAERPTEKVAQCGAGRNFNGELEARRHVEEAGTRPPDHHPRTLGTIAGGQKELHGENTVTRAYIAGVHFGGKIIIG